jgi:hypothetical protein
LLTIEGFWWFIISIVIEINNTAIAPMIVIETDIPMEV